MRTNTQSGRRSKGDAVPLPPLVTIPRSSAAPPQRNMGNKPHKADLHHADVPKPIVLSGSFSPRCTSTSRAPALAKISTSRTSTRAGAGSRLTKCTASRITNRPNEATKRPVQVASFDLPVRETEEALFPAEGTMSFLFNHKCARRLLPVIGCQRASRDNTIVAEASYTRRATLEEP